VRQRRKESASEAELSREDGGRAGSAESVEPEVLAEDGAAGELRAPERERERGGGGCLGEAGRSRRALAEVDLPKRPPRLNMADGGAEERPAREESPASHPLRPTRVGYSVALEIAVRGKVRGESEQ